ncbi:MAG: DUF58 domain-containing protein [bacterium]|nr:DUF58 domain-containing protein [bacterium]
MRQAVSKFIDPLELSRISDLQVLARTVVAGLGAGVHRSLHTGTSAEFAQYRSYAQGDDLRFVDWRLYGRTDRLHVKQFQDESNVRATVLLDCSASMNYGSGPVTKFKYAQMLAACLVMIMSDQRDEVGFASYHRELVVHLPARRQKGQLNRLLGAIQDSEPAGNETDTAGVLQFLGDVLQPRGMVVLIADLLHPVEDMLAHLRSMRARRHDVLVLQVSDPAEQSFPFECSVTLVDLEGRREQFAVPQDVREIYLENRRRHFDTIHKACLSAEIDIEEFVCSEPLDRVLHHFVNRRNRGLLTTSRRQGRGSK